MRGRTRPTASYNRRGRTCFLALRSLKDRVLLSMLAFNLISRFFIVSCSTSTLC